MDFQHYELDLYPKQRENLEKLARYLHALPPEYEKFDMYHCMQIDGSSCGFPEDAKELLEQEGCGTAACALGHGPSAGIPPLKRLDSWNKYASQFLPGYRGSAFEFLFGSHWVEIDNTPKGAADRIDYALQYGIPKYSGHWWAWKERGGTWERKLFQ